MTHTAFVTIHDTTLRDGKQSAGVAFSSDENRGITTQHAALRLSVIDSGANALLTQIRNFVAAYTLAPETADLHGLPTSVRSHLHV